MRSGIYTLTQSYLSRISGHSFRNTVFCILLLTGISNTLNAQHHEHDSVIILSKQELNVNIVSSSNNLLKLQVINLKTDSITPVFIEFTVNGFILASECILDQKVNNNLVVKNIEKIWGPEFISVGIGSLPPLGTYQLDLSLLNGIPDGSSITVRIYGSVTGHDILWTGIIKK